MGADIFYTLQPNMEGNILDARVAETHASLKDSAAGTGGSCRHLYSPSWIAAYG